MGLGVPKQALACCKKVNSSRQSSGRRGVRVTAAGGCKAALCAARPLQRRQAKGQALACITPAEVHLLPACESGGACLRTSWLLATIEDSVAQATIYVVLLVAIFAIINVSDILVACILGVPDDNYAFSTKVGTCNGGGLQHAWHFQNHYTRTYHAPPLVSQRS